MTQRYKQLIDMVRFARPETIIEVGTHNGKHADWLCRAALQQRNQVHYVGYDLFELADDATNRLELNGKGAGSEARARAKLDAIAKEHPGFSYHLVKGNTRDTLHGSMHCADFVFIDGGHSIETIRGDFDALKTSRVIALDDYYSGRIDVTKCGCNLVIADVPHVVLPRMDTGRAGGVQIAAIGYDPKWTDALEQCRERYKLDTIAFWQYGQTIFSDFIACINVLEREPDIEAALENVVRVTGKLIFFVLKEDAIRSIAWWKETLRKHFLIDEWYGGGGEVCGTARPLREIAEVKSHAVWNDDKRFQNIKTNIAKISKRVVMDRNAPPHGGRVMLICPGPSLKETWPFIPLEKKERGGVIVTVSGAHDFLVERGIVPDYHVECDPRPHKALGIAKGIEGVKYYIASCAHPDVITRLEGHDVSLWHMASGHEGMAQIAELEDGAQAIPGGGNAGLRAWAMFYLMGNRVFSMHGMDCSFAGLTKEDQHAGKHYGSKQLIIEVITQDGRQFQSSAVLVAYANQFKDSLQYMGDCMLEMHGDGLLQHWCRLGSGNKAAA